MRRIPVVLFFAFLCLALGSCASLYNIPEEAAPPDEPFMSDPVPGDQSGLGSFDTLDYNGDGYINEEEWARQFPGGDTQIFMNTDKNRDAKIDMDEFKDINRDLDYGN